MLVPGHVVSLYVATCGLNGVGLGADEKEIILLVYVVIDVATTKIVGIQQYLVRPDGELSSSCRSSNGTPSLTDHNNINNTAIAATATTTTSSSSSSSSSSSNGSTVNDGDGVVITNTLPAILNRPATPPQQSQPPQSCSPSNSGGGGGCVTIAPLSQSSPIPSDDGIVAVATATQSGVGELPITESLIQLTGRPLKDVIEQFDVYIRSLSIDPTGPNFRLIVDGQLPLRQCLHPEACTKDIQLPSYYWRFTDLRKDFVRFKSGDLSRALVPFGDAKTLLNLPMLPVLPSSIGDMLKELEQITYSEADFYVKESRDMVSVIQTLLLAGHKFESDEVISLTLEPGICSIDDEIDGSCIVRARGLPWQSSDQDIAKFFRGLNVAKGGVALCLSPQGRRNGEALIRFVSLEHRDMALKRHKHHIGNRYIEVYRASGEDFLAVAGGASNEAQAFLSKGAQVIIRMRGLPYDCTAKQVLEFFSNGENSCAVLDGVDGVLFVKKPDGRATGDAFVLFSTETDSPKALSRHRESIGNRYIELFRSTTAEVQQVLNRSLDPKTYELPAPPLIAQLPPVQMLPQHVITSGTSKDCIRLRGLPYEAKVEHILHFLEDFAKHIVYQGVHMVYNAQGQPSGEAFIQMDSEASAYASAAKKHNKYMLFGKKQRYIEVFACSGDDMNLVLTGGLHSPVQSSKGVGAGSLVSAGGPPSQSSAAAAAAAAAAAILSPGGTMVGSPYGGYAPFAQATAVLPAPSPRGMAHPGAAYYTQPIVYWGYPSPPVSPTAYYGPSPGAQPPPTNATMAAQQSAALYPIEFVSGHPTTCPSPLHFHHHSAAAAAAAAAAVAAAHHHHHHHHHLSASQNMNGTANGPQHLLTTVDSMLPDKLLLTPTTTSVAGHQLIAASAAAGGTNGINGQSPLSPSSSAMINPGMQSATSQYVELFIV